MLEIEPLNPYLAQHLTKLFAKSLMQKQFHGRDIQKSVAKICD